MDLAKTIKLLAQIGGITQEIGEYTAPVVKMIAAQRAKAPTTSTGQDLTVFDVQQQIDHAMATAQSIEDKAKAELAKPE